MEKVLVISDLHLTHRFDPDKFNLLQSIISDRSLVILNGDFWDAYCTSFDKFIDSEWQLLFRILKEKNTIYVCGNHDALNFADSRVARFSESQTDSYYFESSGEKFFVMHGHAVIPTPDIQHAWLPRDTFLGGIPLLYQSNGYKILGEEFFFRYRRNNQMIKNWQQKNLGQDMTLITGHTHLAEHDPRLKFANSGLINFGIATYIKIDRGELQLIKTTY